MAETVDYSWFTLARDSRFLSPQYLPPRSKGDTIDVSPLAP